MCHIGHTKIQAQQIHVPHRTRAINKIPKMRTTHESMTYDYRDILQS
jgi:hypothetical protein